MICLSTDTASSHIYTLSLHDALPIFPHPLWKQGIYLYLVVLFFLILLKGQLNALPSIVLYLMFLCPKYSHPLLFLKRVDMSTLYLQEKLRLSVKAKQVALFPDDQIL